MKFISLFIVFIFGNVLLNAQNKDYDSALAKKLNADAYGMKKYYLIILKKGTGEVKDKARQDSVFRGHMRNIQALAAQNKLVIAGPLDKNDKNYEGIFVLNTESKTEAEQMIASDPAFQSKLLVAEFYLWYGSAALQETLEIHRKIQKENF